MIYKRNGILLHRKFREYLIPTILTTIAIKIGSIVSSVEVGNLLSETALSSLGLTLPIAYTINAVFTLFAIGGSTAASIAIGQRDKETADKIFSLTFLVGFITTFLFTKLILLFVHPISNMLARGDVELVGMVSDYLKVYSFIGPIFMLTLGMACFVRIDGKPRISASIVLTSNIVNLVLTYIFIKYFGWGMRGAGIAAVIGYGSGFFVLIPYLFSPQRSLRFKKLVFKDISLLPKIIKIGSPNAINFGLSFLRTMTLNILIVSTLGASGIAAMTVALKSLMLGTLFLGGTNDTLLPIVGTLFGEKDYSGIHFSVKIGFRFIICVIVAVTAIFLVVPDMVGRFFGIQSVEGLAMITPALRMFALSVPFYGINTMLQKYYQTTGRIKLANLIVFLNGFALICLFAFIFSKWNANLIWLSFLLADALTLLIVLFIGAKTRKKENVAGILLLQQETEGIVYDISIPATIEASVDISNQIIDFCTLNGVNKSGAMKIGIAVEEMSVNISSYGHKTHTGSIDILVRIRKDELILRLRDDGIPFDPTLYQPEEKNTFAVGGIEVVRRLAKEINYSRPLGFNVNIITIPRNLL